LTRFLFFSGGDIEMEADSDKDDANGGQGELGEWLDQLQALSEVCSHFSTFL
jgi:hypothetical protein